MDALQSQQMALDGQRRSRARLQAVRAALQRMDNDDYGYCSVCDEEIALARLQFDPSLSRCVNCAE